MKISKLLVMALVVLAVITVSFSVNAFTNNELITYLTNTHTVNGTHYSLSADQVKAITDYLTANPVSDEVAAAIKGDIEAAEAKIAATGAIWKEQLDRGVGAEVIALMKSAANRAGLTFTFNTQTRVASLTDRSGKVVCTGNIDAFYRDSANGTVSNSTLVYTGANALVYILPVLAVVAVATLLVVKRRD